eukprot:jgi/Galph1/5968/GphlegSOOS_G4581.1
MSESGAKKLYKTVDSFSEAPLKEAATHSQFKTNDNDNFLSESFVQDCNEEGFALEKEFSRLGADLSYMKAEKFEHNSTSKWFTSEASNFEHASSSPSSDLFDRFSVDSEASIDDTKDLSPAVTKHQLSKQHRIDRDGTEEETFYRSSPLKENFSENNSLLDNNDKNNMRLTFCRDFPKISSSQRLHAISGPKDQCGTLSCSFSLTSKSSFSNEELLTHNHKVEDSSRFGEKRDSHVSRLQDFNRVVVWYPDSQGSWSLGYLTSNGEILDLKGHRMSELPSNNTENKSIFSSNDKKYHLFHEDDLNDFDDAVELRSLHEAPILDLLRRRYATEKIYTCVGGDTLLISINPYCTTPGLSMNQQWRVFILARSMMSSKSPQSLIISGESGAGKTEACKYILKYLVFLNDKQRSLRNSCDTCKFYGMETFRESLDRGNMPQNILRKSRVISEKLLHANPVLEAFGNARTCLNSNSSRFGKLIQIFYCLETGHILSARVRQFLFEKSRVTSASHRFGERNYHIFYQMIAGASPDERRTWQVADSLSYYRYLHGTEMASLNRKEDARDFLKTKSCMSSLGLSTDEMDRIFCILSGLLIVGNVDFVCDENEVCLVRNSETLETAAKLLMLDACALGHALTTNSVIVRNERFERRRTVEQAAYARDALAKHIYEMLFAYLVNRLNQLLDPSFHQPEVDNWLSDLGNGNSIDDQSGFEVTGNNSLEQLLINYSNEKLQQQFNERISQCERDIYDEEDIPWHLVDIDNTDCQKRLDILERKPLGLLHLLDEECLAPRGTDERFLHKLVETVQNSSDYYRDFIQISELGRSHGEFQFHHFAGDVTYQSQDMVRKNRDHLHFDLLQVLQKSNNSIISSCLLAGVEPEASFIISPHCNLENSASVSRSFTWDATVSSTSPLTSTVLSQFRPQLHSLMEILNSTTPRYVRCVKPNGRTRPHEFRSNDVLRQLQCAGVFEYVRLRRSGLPVRVPYEDFFMRFKVLCYGMNTCPNSLNLSRLMDNILERLRTVADKRYAIGKSRVFISDELYKSLEHQRFLIFTEAATVIQRQWKLCILRREYLNLRQKTIFLQNLWRQWGPRKRYLHLKKSCEKIAGAYQTYRKRKEFIDIRNATVVFQKITRRWIVCNFERLVRIRAAVTIQKQFRKHLYHRRQIASIVIQKHWRAFQQRRKFLDWKDSSIKVQSFWRCSYLRKKFVLMQNSAVEIQKTWKMYTEHKRMLLVYHYVLFAQSQRRMRIHRKAYLILKSSTVSIQAWFRCQYARKQFVELRKSVILVQERVRRFLAGRHILAYFKGSQCRKMLKKHINAVVTIQRFTRGFFARKLFRYLWDISLHRFASSPVSCHVLVVGAAGVGKSSLINLLFGRRVVPVVGYDTISENSFLDTSIVSGAVEPSGPKLVVSSCFPSGPGIQQVREYSNVHVRAISLPGLVLLDTVGVQDIYSAQALMHNLRQLPTMNITSVIFVDRFDAHRVPEESLRALAVAFGPQIYERTIFAFTHADAPVRKGVRPEQVLQVKIAALSSCLQKIISEVAEKSSCDLLLSGNTASGIPVCLFDASEFFFSSRVDNPLNFASLRRLMSELLRQSTMDSVWSNILYHSGGDNSFHARRRYGSHYSHFRTLGVSTSATFEEVRRAYRRLVLKYHPDRNRGMGTENIVKFRKVVQAYQALNEYYGAGMEDSVDMWWREEVLLSFCFEVSIQTAHGKFLRSSDSHYVTSSRLNESYFENDNVSDDMRFVVWFVPSSRRGKFAISSSDGRFCTLDRHNYLILQYPPAVAFRDGVLNDEVFEMPAFLFSLNFMSSKGILTIKAPNGRYLSATKKDEKLIADRTRAKAWETFAWRLNPSKRAPCYRFDDIVHNQFIAVVQTNGGFFWESDPKLQRMKTRGVQFELAERILFEFCGWTKDNGSSSFPQYRLRCGDGRIICATKEGHISTVQNWQDSAELLLLKKGVLISRFAVQFLNNGKAIFFYISNYEKYYISCDERRGILSTRLKREIANATFTLSFLFEDYETMRRLEYMTKESTISETESMVSENS